MTNGGRLHVPLWLAPVLAGLATLLLFREFIFSDAMLVGEDTLSLGYVAREFFARAVTDAGVFPRWNPYILGGTPFLEALSGGDALYPTSLLLFVMEPYRALGWKLVLHVFLAGVFTYGWIRSLGRSRAAATVACVAYAVAPFLVSLVQPGHDGKLFVTALTPLMFWAMEGTFTRRGLLPYVLVSLVVALVLLTTHFQLAYFLFGASGAYYLFRVLVHARVSKPSDTGDATREGVGPPEEPVGGAGAARVWRGAAGRFGLFLLAAVLGASAAGIQLIPAFQYVTEFSRRTATTTAADPSANLEYASSWSLHPEEVAGLVVPEFPGNTAGGAAWAQDSYWGRNIIRDNHHYAGLVVLMLAVVGFLGTPRRGFRWFLAGLGSVAILYALGAHTPVWRVFYEVLPGVRLFRAPDMVAFLFGFSAITLAAFGVDRLLAMAGVPMAPEDDRARRRHGGAGSREGGGTDNGRADGRWRPGPEGDGRVVTVLLALTGVLALGMLLSASGALTSLWTSVVWPDIPARSQAILEAHRPFLVRGFLVATLLAAALAGAAWAARRGYLKPVGVALALLLLVFVDGFRVSTAFIETLDFEAWARPDPILERLVELQDTEPPFRVGSLARAGQETRPAMFGLELATGHHPNDLARYRELIGMRGSGQPENLGHPNVLALLNLRYLIYPGELQGLPPVLQTQVGGQIHESLYELPTLPRARLVADATVVPEEDAVATILSEGFDPESTVLLSEPPPLELAGGPVQGGVEWIERGINRQRLRVVSDRAALLVLADNWFPAWQATVGGRDAPVLRAYHTLRAVPVPEGEHEVEVHYRSDTLRSSLAVSLGTLLLLLVVGVGDAVRSWRGRRSD